MATDGYATNANLNLKNRLAVSNGAWLSKNWIKCSVAPIANTVMWKSLIKGHGYSSQALCFLKSTARRDHVNTAFDGCKLSNKHRNVSI